MTCLVPFAVACIGAFQDLKTGLIKNWLTVPFLLIALARAVKEGGWPFAVSAFFAGLTAFLAVYCFSTPGGGDLKLALSVGAWYGFREWPLFVGGALLSRVILSLIVKAKVYTLKGFLLGIRTELATGLVPALGERNFAAFQQAARLAGDTSGLPAVPGALWVLGGTTVVLFLNMVGFAL